MLNHIQYIKRIVSTKPIPKVRVGATIKVFQRIKEGGKTRTQAFEGLVIAKKHGNEPGATMTLRKVIDGIGVEKIYPLYSPTIEKIEVVRTAKVRRAKLYYVRTKTKKEIRRKVKNLSAKTQKVTLEMPEKTGIIETK